MYFFAIFQAKCQLQKLEILKWDYFMKFMIYFGFISIYNVLQSLNFHLGTKRAVAGVLLMSSSRGKIVAIDKKFTKYH